MNNAHEQADGASANADTDGRCSAVLSGFNFNAVDVKMTTCSSSSSEGNMHSAQHPIHGEHSMEGESNAQMIGESDAVDGVGIQEISVPSERFTKPHPLDSKPITLGSFPLGIREDESAVKDACIRLGEKNKNDNTTNAADVKMTARHSEDSLPVAQLPIHDEFNFQTGDEGDAIFSNVIVDHEQSSKPLNSEPMSFGSSTLGTRDDERDVQIANSRLRSEPVKLGSSPLEAGEDTSVLKDAGPHFGDDGNNISIQLQISTDANEEKENIGEQPPPARMRSVRFAPSNKVRQFDGDCAVSTLLQEKEGRVELQNNAGKVVRRRKRARSTRSTGIDEPIAKGKEGVCIRDSSPDIAGSPPYPVYSDNSIPTHQPMTKKPIQIVLLHSHSHTQILHKAMQYIHQDRDILLESLMKWCGIFHGANAGGALSSFLTIQPPKMGKRKLLETFHDRDYLDLLQNNPFHSFNGLIQENGDSTNKDCAGSMNDNRDSNCNSSSNSIDMEEQSNVSWDGTCIESYEEQMSLPYEESYLQLPSNEILSKYGLEDDCPFPTTVQAHALLWKYCLAIAGASWHAASLLTANESENQTDVAIHWGGGRHHAHANKAGGFCYVSDVVLAIHRLLLGHDSKIDVDMLEDHNYGAHSISIQRNLSFRRILYIDIDIHHADAVQAAFYSTDRVLTASFHRHSPGFFPASSGSINEKGEVGTSGLGYNLNIPLPAGIADVQFIQIYRKALFGLVKAYDPHAIVLCVGADGLEGDELVSGSLGGDDITGEGWTLSPEGLAECVRIAAALCAGWYEDDICVSPMEEQEEKKVSASAMGNANDIDTDNASCVNDVKAETPKRGRRRKLLLLGGGGYTPAQTARTYLLCSAAACEGARPGMLWSELPRDIPSHDYFPRYGPMFELVSEQKKTQIFSSYSSSKTTHSSDEEICGEKIETYHEVTDSDRQVLREANRAIELSILYIDRQREKKTPQKSSFRFDAVMEHDEEMLDGSQPRKKRPNSRGGRRRKKKKTEIDVSQHSETTSSTQK